VVDENDTMKGFKKYLPLILIVMLSITVWLLGLHHYLTLESLKSHHHILEKSLQTHPFLSIGIYAGIYILIAALSIPAAAFMTILGGFLFGQWSGTAAAVISSTIGACILFMSAKMASENLAKKTGPWAKKMQDGFQNNAFSYLLTLRLIPIFPFVAVNLVAALFQTFIGVIPGSFVYVSMGVALREVIKTSHITPRIILEPKILIALIGLGALSLLPVMYKKLNRKA
jgi:uncharacterized membrane protein YdjX (TVP38/TMEM64 family)